MMQEWKVMDSEGKEHTVAYGRKGCLSRKLLVDGEKPEAKSMSCWMELVDVEIAFGDTACHLVAVGKDADLAVNGRFLGSGEEYSPVAAIPTWVNVLCVVSVVGGLLLGGLIDLCIGIFAASFYLKAALKEDYAKVKKIFAGCTVLQLVMAGILVMLLHG